MRRTSWRPIYVYISGCLFAFAAVASQSWQQHKCQTNIRLVQPAQWASEAAAAFEVPVIRVAASLQAVTPAVAAKPAAPVANQIVLEPKVALRNSSSRGPLRSDSRKDQGRLPDIAEPANNNLPPVRTPRSYGHQMGPVDADFPLPPQSPTPQQQGQFKEQPIHDVPRNGDVAPIIDQKKYIEQQQSSQNNVPDPRQADLQEVTSQVADWLQPTALHEELNKLLEVPAARLWASNSLAALKAIRSAPSLMDPVVSNSLTRLDHLARTAEANATQLAWQRQAQMRRAGYSLRRRVDVWTAASQAMQYDQAALTTRVLEFRRPNNMLRHIDEIRSIVSGGTDQQCGWMDFLLLDRLANADASQRPDVARRVLRRIHDTDLTVAQRQFLKTPGLQQFTGQLRQWATDTISVENVLASIESVECTPSGAANRRLARHWNQLRWSVVPSHLALARPIETHYRNANFRVSMSESMINRMLPSLQDAVEPVKDHILGADVRGRSRSRTRLLVNLIPDGDRIRLMLEARGSTAAKTASTTGPVTLFSRGNSNYTVRKIMQFGPSGHQMGQTRVVAAGRMNLTGLRTGFDRIPVIGSIVRNVAKQRHDESRSAARRIFESKVARVARQRVDANVQSKVTAAKRKLEAQVIDPLESLELDPRTLAMHTSEDRLVLRGRLAGNEQIAAFTPRPRAVKDNAMSMQIHQSAFNNLIEQLQLDGRELTIQELRTEIARKFDKEPQDLSEEMPADIKLKFAAEDAVCITCDEGLVRITLNMVSLRGPERLWKDFAVSTTYKPHVDGLQVALRREGPIEVRQRKSRRGRLALITVFTKVFSPNREFNLIAPAMSEDKRFEGLAVSQVAVLDGWIGVSVSTEKEIERQHQISCRCQNFNR